MASEHDLDRIVLAYEKLRADPVEWASYQAEARLTDNAAGDGLGNAAEEYPEYNVAPAEWDGRLAGAGADEFDEPS